MVPTNKTGNPSLLQGWFDLNYPLLGTFFRWFGQNLAKAIAVCLSLVLSSSVIVLKLVSCLFDFHFDKAENQMITCMVVIFPLLLIVVLHLCYRRETNL